MAEPTQYAFRHKEVVEALIKQQGLHEGIWLLTVKFGLAATNAGESEETLNPTALVPVLEIGLKAAEKEASLAVDAAKVNPRRPVQKSPRTTRKVGG
jgi:hypothetical protein